MVQGGLAMEDGKVRDQPSRAVPVVVSHHLAVEQLRHYEERIVSTWADSVHPQGCCC